MQRSAEEGVFEEAPSEGGCSSPQEALARLEAAFEHLRQHFIHRDGVLEQILYALLTREHALIIGDRGLAKSRLARSVFAHIRDDREPFSLQLTRTTSVGQLVGGLDLREFEKGAYVHNLDGYIVHAHFAFLDELFDANDFVLRALNGILNERMFLNGPQMEKAELHTAIATTNYIRDTRESRAILDRFLFKSIVHRAESALERLQIRREFMQSHGSTIAGSPTGGLAYEDIRQLSAIILGEDPEHSIEVPAHILVILDEMISTFEKRMNESILSGERFVFSDRTKNKAIQVLMASALRANRYLVEMKDLASLHFIVPTIGSNEEESVFDDAMASTLRQFPAQERESIDRVAAIMDLLNEFVARHAAGELEEPSWADRVRSQVDKLLFRKHEVLTLGTLMDEARNLAAEAASTRKLKEDLISAIGTAHERHHIRFEQRLHK